MRNMILMLLLLLVPCLALAAQAQPEGPYIPFDDEVYVTDYFGTQLVVFMTDRMVSSDEEWWTEKLPQDLIDDQQSMVELVNEQRQAQGAPLLDPEGWYIETGWEEETDGGWQYDISFYGMRPSEAQMLLDEFGGAATLFPDGQFSYMPCKRRVFDARVGNLDDDYVLLLAEQEYRFDPGKRIDELQDDISQAFAKAYNEDVTVDLTLSQYMDHSGNLDMMLMVNAEMPED